MPDPIVLPPLTDLVAELWEALFDLHASVRGPWTLVGGQMVLLHALEHGVEPAQISQDGDVLADVRADQDGIRKVVAALEHLGFELEGIATGGVGHRYRRRRTERQQPVTVDVLAPDHLGDRADLTTSPPGRTIEVPGGTQALARTELISVQLGERTGQVPRPDLVGAIVAKARACLLAGDTTRHERDLALLLSLVPDPFSARRQFANKDLAHLASATALADPTAAAWRLLPPDRREQGQAARAILLTP